MQQAFYARQRIYAIIRLSVHLSVTQVDQSKTVEGRITLFSPYGSPIPLVFREQVSSWNSEGFPQSRGIKWGWGSKIGDFRLLSRHISETVQDSTKVLLITNRNCVHALSIGTKINNLGWPWTDKRPFLHHYTVSQKNKQNHISGFIGSLRSPWKSLKSPWIWIFHILKNFAFKILKKAFL